MYSYVRVHTTRLSKYLLSKSVINRGLFLLGVIKIWGEQNIAKCFNSQFVLKFLKIIKTLRKV